MSEEVTLAAVDTARLDKLCRQFLALARNKMTGTLVVVSATGEQKSFLCHSGQVVDVHTGRPEGIMTEAILASVEISPRQVKRAQKHAEKCELTLGEALLDLEIASQNDVLNSIELIVSDEVTDVFHWDVEQVHFSQHSARETTEDFNNELSRYFELRADPEDLFLDACKRLDSWDLIKNHFDLFLDVFYATPGTFRYFREADVYPHEVRILGAIDGTRDVEEVIEESGLNPFDALIVIRDLITHGEIELINPVQMFQLGSELASQGSLDKAVKLFKRSKERGLNDFDLELRLAESLDKLGRRNEAALWYLEFSGSCLSQLRVDDAISALKRVIDLCPDQDVALDKLLEIYVQQKRSQEAVEVALKIAEQKERVGAPKEALDVLTSLRQLATGEAEFHERIIQLAEACGRSDLVASEKRLLAQTYDEHKDAQSALQTYQSMFCEGNDSLEVRLKLIDLHTQQSHRQKAIDHINGALSLGGKQRIKDADTLRQLHGSMVRLKPGDCRSSRWLVEDAIQRDDMNQAVEYLRSWLKVLERDDDHAEMIDVLEQLIRFDNKAEHRWALASVFEKLGRVEDGQRELRSLANLAIRGKDFNEAARTLDHLIKKAPFDVSSRKAQVDLYDSMGERELATARLKEVTLLEIIAGEVQEAEECCRRLLLLDPNLAEIVDSLGVLCLDLGDQQKAAEQFVKAAKIHIERENFGSARSTVDRLLAACPAHPEGLALHERLQKRKEEEATPAAPATVEEAVSTPQPGRASAAPRLKQVRTTVSSITAKLRNLQSGNSGDAGVTITAPDPTDAERSIDGKSSEGGVSEAESTRSSIAEIASRLRKLDSGSEAGRAQESAESLSPLSLPSAQSTAAAVEGSTEETPAGSAASSASTGSVLSAASRLRALATAGQSAAQPAADSNADTAAPGDTATAGAPETPEAPPVASPPTSSDVTPGQAPETAKVKVQLGGAASKLAALRKQS